MLLDMVEQTQPRFVADMRDWAPKTINPKIRQVEEKPSDYKEDWINNDLLFHTAVGAGFIALRDNDALELDRATEKDLDRIEETFATGVKYGFEAAAANFQKSMERFNRFLG